MPSTSRVLAMRGLISRRAFIPCDISSRLGYRGMTKLSLPSLLVLCVVVWPCSDDDSGSLAVDVANASSFCRAAAVTACSTMYACLTDVELRDKELPATAAECERVFESNCE